MTQADLTRFARHGGRLADARRAFPDSPAPWLDLSTGINPVAWAPPSGLPVDDGPLPDVTALARLEAVAAAAFGAPADRVVAVPGSEIALRLLPFAGLPTPITAVLPGYGTHAAVAQTVADGLAARPGTLLLANPNNPDGRAIPPAALHALAVRQREGGGWLAVDEAFVDATLTWSVLPGLDAEAPVVVLRSFGKFFGLAGLRLGFVVAPPAIAARYRDLLGDWPVGAQAIAWGSAAYADRAWIEATRRALAGAAAALDRVLARHGLTATGASPLFRLVQHPEAQVVFTRLARAGILTRPFADRPDWLRVGLPGSDEGLDRLDRALAGG